MRITFIVIFLLTGSLLFGQSDSLEKEVLLKRLNDKQINQEEFSKTYNSWNNTIKAFGKYPDLPVNKNGFVSYSFILEVPGISKKLMFSQLMEWLAINYGLFPANYYSSQEDGKIIYHNMFNTDGNNSCSFVAVISVADGMALVEFINILHHSYIPGRYVNDVWVPEKSIDTDLEGMYPLITRKSTEWNLGLNLFRLINNYFEMAANEFYRYITRSGK